MKHVLAGILIALTLASCGVRGDPEAPRFTQGQ
jgi:Prokaryotic lipoprotein-attachment site